MIDTKNLRKLTQAALAGHDGVSLNWLKLLQDFQKEASPAAISELLDRLEAVEKERDSYKFAFSEYSEKTEWVQQGINDGTVSAKYLGWHRADVMSDLLRAVEKERDALRAKIEEMEQQEPVEWQTRTIPAWNDGTWGPWRKCSEEYAEDIKKTPLLHDWLYEARALYALPGAKGE
jgi:hypothetical protein